MPTVERAGWRLSYEVTGTGDRTVVLTHGLASSRATWAAQVAALAPSYRVVTWDLRAHGASACPGEACTIAALGDDLAAIARAAADGPVHVLGHSAGGVVALRFAIDHAPLARSLILVGTASECNDRAQRFYESLAATAERDGGAAVVRRLGGDETAAPPDAAGFARLARAIGNLRIAPLTPELGRVRCPTLVIVGEKDFLGVGGSVILSRGIAGARLAIVPGQGHGLFHDDAPAFNRLVLDFLREVG